MRIVWIVLGVLFGLAVLGFFAASIGLKSMKEMIINEVDLSKLEDGVYTGRFHKVRWTYEVEVTVENHKIVEIVTISKTDDEHSRRVSAGATEAIIANQSVQIDAVSGATVSTKAFQKAVENALTGTED